MADSPAQADVLNGVRQILKRCDQSLGGVCADFGMTRIETDILAFLYNHPQNDTAADVVRMRMLPKGNVSQGVDALEKKGFLRRIPDERDRRRIHLWVTDEGLRATCAVLAARQEWESVLFADFSPQERALFSDFMQRIFSNAARQDDASV